MRAVPSQQDWLYTKGAAKARLAVGMVAAGACTAGRWQASTATGKRNFRGPAMQEKATWWDAEG